MYIVNGIAYAGNQTPALKVSGIRPLSNFRLWVRFNTSEVKIFDFKPLLKSPAFTLLEDPEMFKNVYIDYGIPVWNDGSIDIAPEMLYEKGISAEDISIA